MAAERTVADERSGPSWGALRPRRLLPHEPRGDRSDSGEPLVSVLVPRFRTRWIRGLSRRLGLGDVRVHLDGPGSCVWRHCDGTHTVERIGEVLRERFGERVEPVEQRLPELLRQMYRAGMVTWDAGIGTE